MGKKKTVLGFYHSRFQRILIPYWIYAINCILITFILKNQENYFSFEIPTIFSPVTQVPYLLYAIWFVPVYLYVILLFPLLKWYYEQFDNRIRLYLPFAVFVILLLLFSYISQLAQTVCFYSFWIYLGLFYRKMNVNTIKYKQKIAGCIIFCVLLVLAFVWHDHKYANMQYNKFPPNVVFLVYTFGALSAFYLCSKYILTGIRFLRRKNLLNWVFKQYEHNCYTIFLYHPFSFLLIFYLRKYCESFDYIFQVNSLISFSLYLILTLSISAFWGKLFSWTERIKIIKK